MPRCWVGLLLITLATSARADDAPDPDSIQAHCTPAEQCPHGERCTDYASATKSGLERAKVHENFALCEEKQRAKNYEIRCGGKNWALYCPPGERGSWPPTRGEIVRRIALWALPFAALIALFAVARVRAQRRKNAGRQS